MLHVDGSEERRELSAVMWCPACRNVVGGGDFASAEAALRDCVEEPCDDCGSVLVLWAADWQVWTPSIGWVDDGTLVPWGAPLGVRAVARTPEGRTTGLGPDQ